MFWRFGGYANISSLDSILDKPDVTLEEILDESDLIQELKQHNSKLIEYLREENVLRRLLEYVIAPQKPKPETSGGDEETPEASTERKRTFSLSPARKDRKEKTKRQEELEEWEKADKARQKYAYIACEVLSSETWSILEALMENQQHLRKFWDYLKQEPPLEAAEAGYFTKVNEVLLDKKTEETLQFIKSLDAIIPAILRHVDCPMVMDLLLKIISMEKIDGGAGVVDWLQSQDLMPLLLAYLSGDYPQATQTSAGDFIKAIITISANASQNENSCIGPNNLTRQLVSEKCVESLITDMLRGGNPLTVGVGIIIEVIRKNNSDYDPDVGGGADSVPSNSDPIYLGTLLRLFAKHVSDFTALILSPNHTVPNGESTMVIKRKELAVAFKKKIEPLGFDRFKTCELMAELLHCSNMGLLNERGSEELVKQRDQERERLKSEGVLIGAQEPQSAVTDFSEDSTGFHNAGSPLAAIAASSEQRHRLEVANSAEEDGFEDVGASADLAEQIKDEIGAGSSFQLASKPAQLPKQPTPVRPRLDLDEDFVDEPLTSPRLEALDQKNIEPSSEAPEILDVPEPEGGCGALSSSAELESTFNGLSLDTGNEKNHHGTVSNGDEPSSHTTSADAPPLPHRDRFLSPSPANVASPSALSPHAEDTPAPLFTKRSDSSPDDNDSTLKPGELEAHGRNNQDLVDTSMTEEGDSSRSVLTTSNEQNYPPQMGSDVDGAPLVGDFLKIMFVEHQVVPTILDFFFRFPWNNFLHNVVYDVVQQVFNGPMDRGFNRNLAIDLFTTGKITEKIVEGQRRSDEAQKTNNMRLGYMGHLTLIAEEVVKFTERHAPDMLSEEVFNKVTSQRWSEYVEHTLAETRERDNAILGGVRPDMSVGNRQAVLNAVNAAQGFHTGASNALASPGLNTGIGLDSIDLASNGSATSGSYGLSSGALLSGFGSSSDEEDEEMEEMEGEGEPGASIDQQNTTSLITSIFSPPPTTSTNAVQPLPPPLRTPQTRARRRFEARLALHNPPSPSLRDNVYPMEEGDAPPEIVAVIAATQAHMLANRDLAGEGEDVSDAENGDVIGGLGEREREVVREAVEGKMSETPFGDLEDLGTEVGHDVPIGFADGEGKGWFEEDGEGGSSEEEELAGEGEGMRGRRSS